MKTFSVTKAAGLWSITDQGCVSLGNFLTNIFLARALPAADYGIFALVFGLVIFLNSFHSCLIGYPLSVKGAAVDADSLKTYATSGLLFTAILSVPFGTVIYAASVVLGRSDVAIWAASALLCWELQETLRRSLMAHLRHGDALWGDALSYLGQAVLVYLCLFRGRISLQEVFGIIAVTSLCAAGLQALQLRFQSIEKGKLFTPVREFWDAGKWAALANTAVSISTVAFPWVLALRSTRDAASYQALVNLVGIANPIMLGISNMLVPATTRAIHDSGIGHASRTIIKNGLRGAGVLLPYYALLLVSPGLILRVFYGTHSPYLGLAFSLRVLVFAYALIYATHVFAAFFYGLEDSRTVLNVQALGAAVAVVIGLPLARIVGVPGACGGLALAWGIQSVTFLMVFKARAQSPMIVVAHEAGSVLSERKT